MLSAEGDTLNGDGSECFESDSTSGIVADVSAVSDDDLDHIMVWDEDAPCKGSDWSYIHYSGPSSEFAGMTAGAGDMIHTYKAAYFYGGLPVPAGTRKCYPWSTNHDANFYQYTDMRYTCLKKWKVARFGSSCPEQAKQEKVGSTPPAVIVLSAMVALALTGVALGLMSVWVHKRKQQKDLSDPTMKTAEELQATTEEIEAEEEIEASTTTSHTIV